MNMLFEKIGLAEHVHRYDLRNRKGRAFYVTDVHGHFDLLHHELRQVAFDSTKDLLFVGGDNTDRGPDSKFVLDYVTEPWYNSIQGNHERLFMDGFDCHWHPNDRSVQCLKAHGGTWIWGLTDMEKILIREVFGNMPIGIELVFDEYTVGLVHAEVPYSDWNKFLNTTPSELQWNDLATAQWARTWYKQQYQGKVANVDLVLVGHTPTDSGNPEQLGNMVFADGGSFFNNKLNLIEITDDWVKERV